MEELEITHSTLLQIWWACFWRAHLICIFLFIFILICSVVISRNFGLETESVTQRAYLAYLITAIVVHYFTLGKVFKKKFKTFRIALIKDES